MSQFVAIRNGGKTDENAALRFLRRISPNGQGNVQSGDMAVAQHGTPNKSVDIAIGDLIIQYQDYIYYTWIDALYNLTIGDNSSGNDRIDAIVAYVDLSVVSSASNNNPGALKFMDVQGTPSGSPAAPNGTAIQAAVGAGNPYYVLANVRVNNNFTSIVTANITDLRTQFIVSGAPKFLFYMPGTASVNNDLSVDIPGSPQGTTITTIRAHCKTAPVGSSLTVRIYNVTQGVAVASLSISAGSNDANSNTITTPTVNAGDVLRADITAIGSTTPGSDVSVMIY